MHIVYKQIKDFNITQIERLFLSVDWYSGKFPAKLLIALKNSTRVISAWDEDRLVGLIRGLDDGIWQANIDCLLVDPEYQSNGIATTLLEMIKEEYKDFLYLNVAPDEKANVEFYQKREFQILEEGTTMQIRCENW